SDSLFHPCAFPLALWSQARSALFPYTTLFRSVAVCQSTAQEYPQYSLVVLTSHAFLLPSQSYSLLHLEWLEQLFQQLPSKTLLLIHFAASLVVYFDVHSPHLYTTSALLLLLDRHVCLLYS